MTTLLDDRNVGFLLDEVFHVDAICGLPAFAEHSRETIGLLLDSVRRLSRQLPWSRRSRPTPVSGMRAQAAAEPSCLRTSGSSSTEMPSHGAR